MSKDFEYGVAVISSEVDADEADHLKKQLYYDANLSVWTTNYLYEADLTEDTFRQELEYHLEKSRTCRCF